MLSVLGVVAGGVGCAGFCLWWKLIGELASAGYMKTLKVAAVIAAIAAVALGILYCFGG